MLTSLHAVFASDTHQVEGSFLREAPTEREGKSLKYREATRMPFRIRKDRIYMRCKH